VTRFHAWILDKKIFMGGIRTRTFAKPAKLNANAIPLSHASIGKKLINNSYIVHIINGPWDAKSESAKKFKQIWQQLLIFNLDWDFVSMKAFYTDRKYVSSVFVLNSGKFKPSTQNLTVRPLCPYRVGAASNLLCPQAYWACEVM